MTKQPEALPQGRELAILLSQGHYSMREAVDEIRRQWQEIDDLQYRIKELEASESRTITQRDYCEEVIDRMADAVLGKDRHEWTSSYDFMDAAQETEDRIQELESEAEHNARILGASAEKELALRARVEELTKMLHREVQ